MEKEKEIKIILVEDTKEYRENLVYLINREAGFKVVAELSKGEDAVEKFKTLSPDVVLMDLKLDGEMNGIEAIKRIRNIDKSANILVLTKFDGDEDLQSALKNGAAGYLIKSSLTGKITEKIKEVIKGDFPFSPQIVRKLRDYLCKHANKENKIDLLTNRENQILKLIAEGHTYPQIAKICEIAYTTAKTHGSHIYEKLDVNNKIKAANQLKGNF